MIIGAGIAGLEMGRELESAGCSYKILEAQSRIGGRIRTDTETFGAAVDLGATFLHGPKGHPLLRMAKQMNLGLFVPRDGGFYLNGKKATPAEEDQLAQLEDAFYAKVEAAVERGEDPSLAEFLVGLPGAETAVGRFFTEKIGDLEGGLAAEKLGALDSGSFLSSEHDPILKGGMTQIVNEVAKGVPVDKIALDTPIKKIVVKDDGVEIHTKDGNVERARSVVVTASIGVLAAGVIEFDPPLTDETKKAIDGLQMCKMELVHMEVEGAKDLVGETIYHAATDALPAMQFLYKNTPDGRTLAQGFVPGPVAEKYTGNPEGMVELAKAKLAETYGDKLSVLKGIATQWNANPWTRGSYSVSGPGAARFRDVLRKPQFGGRLRFVGEATASAARNASAGGAYQAASRAAKRHIAWLEKQPTDAGAIKASPAARLLLQKK